MENKHIGRIIVLEEKEDEMQNICICPHCGKKAIYGEMIMICGIHGCPNCHEALYKSIFFDREHNYDEYVRKANNHSYEPYRWDEQIAEKENIEKIKERINKMFEKVAVIDKYANKRKELIDLIKKCYYCNSIDGSLSKTSYGFEHPEDIKRIEELLNEQYY